MVAIKDAIKRPIKRILSQLGFLEHLLRVRSELRYGRDNKRFLRENPGFKPPPTPILFDILGRVSYRAFHEDGLHNAKLIGTWIRDLLACKTDVSICEWGCGPARILKHMPSLLRDMQPQ